MFVCEPLEDFEEFRGFGGKGHREIFGSMELVPVSGLGE